MFQRRESHIAILLLFCGVVVLLLLFYGHGMKRDGGRKKIEVSFFFFGGGGVGVEEGCIVGMGDQEDTVPDIPCVDALMVLIYIVHWLGC